MSYLTEYIEQAQQICDGVEPGWIVEDDSVLICPHGNRVEWDGESFDGCVSPILTAGMI